MGRLPGCSSACWIAGPYRHCRLGGRAVGRVRAGTAAGGSPSAPFCRRVRRRCAGPRLYAVRWAVTGVADRQWRAAAPATGTPGRARSVSWSAAALRGCVWSAAVSPYRVFGRSGRVDRKVELGAAPGGHGPVTQNQLAIGRLTRQVVPQLGAKPATANRPGRRGPGRRAASDSDAGTGGPGAWSDHGPCLVMSRRRSCTRGI
jgi:hypothetical protein